MHMLLTFGMKSKISIDLYKLGEYQYIVKHKINYSVLFPS